MIAAKRMHLDEIVGHLKEEELEGEVLGDSDTGSLLYSSLLPINLLIQFILVFVYIAFSFFCSPSDDSEEEEGKGRPYTQEEEDIDVIRSWVEVGGHAAHQEEEAKGLLAEVKHIPMSLFFFLINLSATNFPHNLWCFRLLFAPPSFFTGCETTPICKPKEGRGKKARSRGSAAWDRGVVEIKGGCHGIWGRGFLWTLEGSHLAFLPSSFTTSTVPCPPEPQFPSSPAVSSRVCRTWSLRSRRPCHCICPSSCYSSSWGQPTGRYATPKTSTGGCQKSLSVPGWWLQRGPINLTGSHLCPCEESAPWSGVGVPTLQ